jgi:hypothetical protein
MADSAVTRCPPGDFSVRVLEAFRGGHVAVLRSGDPPALSYLSELVRCADDVVHDFTEGVAGLRPVKRVVAHDGEVWGLTFLASDGTDFEVGALWLVNGGWPVRLGVLGFGVCSDPIAPRFRVLAEFADLSSLEAGLTRVLRCPFGIVGRGLAMIRGFQSAGVAFRPLERWWRSVHKELRDDR